MVNATSTVVIGFGIFVYDLERLVNSFSDKVAKLTANFIKTKRGQRFLSLPILGPIIFFPVQLRVWSDGGVSGYELFSWAMMILINFSTFVSLCHYGEWRTRLSMIGWILTMVSITLAACIR